MDDMIFTGRCNCGAVRYTAQGPQLFGVLCHCRDCQRASGSGHVPIMGVAATGFAVTGTTRSTTMTGSSGMDAVRHFCGGCGSLLFGTPEAAPMMATIYAGSLDNPALFRADAAQFVRSRPVWDVGAATLPEFDTTPPMQDT